MLGLFSDEENFLGIALGASFFLLYFFYLLDVKVKQLSKTIFFLIKICVVKEELALKKTKEMANEPLINV